MSKNIFDSFQLNDLVLKNRIVMAPMTRNRSDKDGIVSPLMVTHYQQRATAGLIVSESVPVSTQAIGYPMTPGIFNEAQSKSWKILTDAVHKEGGRIFIQLQHCGRISHPSMQPQNTLPVAPSAIKPDGLAVTYTGMQEFVQPRALETHEIKELVEQFKIASILAKEAGFDGIEIHGANGYIIDQFLRDGSNHRTDAYGGTVKNRMRLLNEVLDAILLIWPSNRVGVRLTPENSFNSMSDSNPQGHFEFFMEQLSLRGLAYVHVLEGDMMTKKSVVNYSTLRAKFAGNYIANNGYDLGRAQDAINTGTADLIAFGTPFIANPDLVHRFQKNLPLNTLDHSTFYVGGEKGYNDYPFCKA